MDPQIMMAIAQMMGGGGGNGSSFGGQGFGGSGAGLGQFLGGMFGDSGAPFKEARNAYTPYFNQATAAQQPYTQAGQNALMPFQNKLSEMSNPTDFMNKLMGQYQESPWAHYSQQQGVRAANNLGSATGLTGSTPLQMQAQQNAQNISSTDMQDWISKVLGINTQALGGYGNLISGGQNAANQLSNLYNTAGSNMAGLAYGQRQNENQDKSNMIGGAINMFTHGLFG